MPIMPWERGPVGLVLSMRPLMLMPSVEVMAWSRPVPVIPQCALELLETEKSLVPMSRPKARASRARTQWEVKKDLRGRLEARWFQLLRRHPEAGPPAEAAANGDAAPLMDCLAKKSESTLSARLRPLERLETWCGAKPCQAFPLDEESVYGYLRVLRDEDATPSAGKALRESIAFAHYALGIKGAESCLASPRCAGVAWQLEQRMPARRQRPPLTVAQLRTVHSVVVGPCHPPEDRIFAGFWSFLVSVRGRDADVQRVADEPFLDVPEGADEGFIEAACLHHKTAHLRRRQRRLLPMVGFAFSLDGSCWAREWLRLRREQGLHVRKQQCLMPAPMAGGGWSTRRLSSDESQRWLRKLLVESGHAAQDVAPIGTHSGKATLLSWCAKYGVPISTRRLLGGHATLGDSSALEYGRDNLAAPLRELIKVFKDVSTGVFRPDASRSGMLVPELRASAWDPNEPPPAEGVRAVPALEDGPGAEARGDEAGGASSGGTSSPPESSPASSRAGSSSTGSSSEEERAGGPSGASGVSNPKAWRHIHRLTVHRAAEEGPGTGCGRVPPSGLDLSEGPSADWPYEPLSSVPVQAVRFCASKGCFAGMTAVRAASG